MKKENKVKKLFKAGGGEGSLASGAKNLRCNKLSKIKIAARGRGACHRGVPRGRNGGHGNGKLGGGGGCLGDP